MLQLVTARFENFRILRDATIDFSTSADRPLTVIRAENLTGKTTLHTALQWVFYGDDVLPVPTTRQKYRLHPLDWDPVAEGRIVPILGEVTFKYSTTTSTPTGSEEIVEDEYVLRRSSEERLGDDDQFERFTAHPTLLQRTQAGFTPIETNPAVLIEEMIPGSLRDVFFTDGDRALSFIQASQDAKRERVEEAIRALLGLEVVESAHRHVTKALADIRRSLGGGGKGEDDYESLTRRLSDIDDHLLQEQDKRSEARASHARLEQEITQYRERLERALTKGDREELANQLNRANQDRRTAESVLTDRTKKLADLFGESTLALGLLSNFVEKARVQLEPLHNEGKIPSTFVPLIRERLNAGQCICGASLGEGTDEREHLLQHLKEREGDDELNDRLGQLYYRAETFGVSLLDPRERWSDILRDRSRQVDDARYALRRAQEEVAELELKLDQVPETDVAELRRQIKDAEEERANQLKIATLAEAEIARLEEDKLKVSKARDSIMKSQDKYRRQKANEQATEDLLRVLGGTIGVLKGEKLQNVSDEMNRLFLSMIVADPDQNALIQEAAVTPEYDIVVTGSRGRRLDPDTDLSGASRRALTIAFILALTKVSGTSAPNIVDTPLGMTSGEIKRSIVRAALTESTQLVLFLTRDEIHNIEEILDTHVGQICTMSNTGHWPGQLVNKPPFDDMRVLICPCNHREYCATCERLHDATSETLSRRAG